MKKKKLKINVHRPVGTRLKYDEEGNIMPPLAAAIAGPESGNAVLRTDKGLFLLCILWAKLQLTPFMYGEFRLSA